MFEAKKLDQLKLMYNVFNRIDTTIIFIINKMVPYIMMEGKAIVTAPQDKKDKDYPINFTKKLLTFKQEIDDLISVSFNQDMRFQRARDQAFMDFMNGNKKTPHFIAFYLDNEFKRGFKQITEEEQGKKLDSVVRLFCCLHGRDVFIAQYSNLLAQRLLDKTTLSDWAEEQMVNKLTIECGNNTVNKIKTMFEDMIKSKSLNNDFKTTRGGGSIIDGVDFSVEVLTSGHWPYQDIPTCKIPPVMGKIQQVFQNFYTKKFSSRKLHWLFSHGNLQIQTNYLAKKYLVQVNVYQAVILSLFNEHQSLTFSEIKEKCQLEQQDMMDALLKLCSPNSKVLLKDNQKKPQFEPSENIQVNDKFQSNSIRVNLVPQISMNKIQQGGGKAAGIDDLDKEVAKERQHVIDAVTVRIMKMRKTEKANDLMAEIIRQIKIF